MSKLGGAVAEGAQLIEHLYLSFYQELQKPLLDDSSVKGGSDKHTHEQTNQAAVMSIGNEAAAKVMHCLHSLHRHAAFWPNRGGGMGALQVGTT